MRESNIEAAWNHTKYTYHKERAKTKPPKLCFCVKKNTPFFLRFLRVHFSDLFDAGNHFFLALPLLSRNFATVFSPFFEIRDTYKLNAASLLLLCLTDVKSKTGLKAKSLFPLVSKSADTQNCSRIFSIRCLCFTPSYSASLLLGFCLHGVVLCLAFSCRCIFSIMCSRLLYKAAYKNKLNLS